MQFSSASTHTSSHCNRACHFQFFGEISITPRNALPEIGIRRKTTAEAFSLVFTRLVPRQVSSLYVCSI